MLYRRCDSPGASKTGRVITAQSGLSERTEMKISLVQGDAVIEFFFDSMAGDGRDLQFCKRQLTV